MPPFAIKELFLYHPCDKSQGMKQFMAGGGIVLLGVLLIPQLTTLFPAG